jgi:hypothetical protein
MIPEWGDTFWMGSAMAARVCCSASATPSSTLIISGLVRVVSGPPWREWWRMSRPSAWARWWGRGCRWSRAVELPASEGCSAGRGLPGVHRVWPESVGLRVQPLGQAGQRPRGATAQPAGGPARALVRQHGRMRQGRPGEEARLFGAAQGKVVVEHPTLLHPQRLVALQRAPGGGHAGSLPAA